MPLSLKELGEQFGINEKSFKLIRFGGVVGRITLIVIACIAPMAIVAFRTDSPALLWGCVIIPAALGLLAIGVIALHAHKHPAEAIMEGGQIVALRHLEHEIAMKGKPDIVQVEPVPPPKALIAHSETQTETENGGSS